MKHINYFCYLNVAKKYWCISRKNNLSAFLRICSKNDLGALSGKFLRPKVCQPESFDFLGLWQAQVSSIKYKYIVLVLYKYKYQYKYKYKHKYQVSVVQINAGLPNLQDMLKSQILFKQHDTSCKYCRCYFDNLKIVDSALQMFLFVVNLCCNLWGKVEM